MLLSSQFTSNYFSISQVEQNFDDFAADFAGVLSRGPLEPIVWSLLPALRVRTLGGHLQPIVWSPCCLLILLLLRRCAGPVTVVC